MFTILQIEESHSTIKSGADFPKYIQDIKKLGVTAFQTWVKDSRTEYFGQNNFSATSNAQYPDLLIDDFCSKEKFIDRLKAHQKGDTDYFTFCKDCAETGIEKWVVDLEHMTCTYFDKAGNTILVEQIPG